MSLTSDHPSALYFNQCNRDQLFFWVYCYNIDRYYWLQWRKMQVIISKVGGKFWCWEGHISIKHDLARSCFQFWLKIGDEGDRISRKKTGEAPLNLSPYFEAWYFEFREKTVSASASPVFFSRNFVTLVADFGPKLKTWSRQIMFYTKSAKNRIVSILSIKWKAYSVSLKQLSTLFKISKIFTTGSKYLHIRRDIRHYIASASHWFIRNCSQGRNFVV